MRRRTQVPALRLQIRGGVQSGAGLLCYMTDDCLAALADGHMLHGDLLLATSAVALKRFHLSGKRPRQHIQSTLRAHRLADENVLSTPRRGQAIV